MLPSNIFFLYIHELSALQAFLFQNPVYMGTFSISCFNMVVSFISDRKFTVIFFFKVLS